MGPCPKTIKWFETMGIILAQGTHCGPSYLQINKCRLHSFFFIGQFLGSPKPDDVCFLQKWKTLKILYNFCFLKFFVRRLCITTYFEVKNLSRRSSYCLSFYVYRKPLRPSTIFVSMVYLSDHSKLLK